VRQVYNAGDRTENRQPLEETHSCAPVLAISLTAICCASSALAQTYPNKPIRVVVPYAAGGTSDILARQIGPKLTESFGQPVVVENKPGANGNVGAEFVAKSAPDGHTLLLTDVGGLVISPSVLSEPAVRSGEGFQPDHHGVVLAARARGASVGAGEGRKELVAMAKAHPGKLNFAISGIGGAPHLAGIEFAQRTGVDWTYIPYKGGSDAVTGVVAGQAHVLFNGMLATWPSVTGGKLKAIGISSGARVAAAPDTPTVAEQGLPGFETGSFQGLVGPAGIPPDTVAKLNGELRRVLNTADMKERFAKQGTEVRAGPAQQLGDYLRNEKARWAKVVKESGAKFD
jgi:tripartite-type tricarboxylate transporter receptor subunit TctC